MVHMEFGVCVMALHSKGLDGNRSCSHRSGHLMPALPTSALSLVHTVFLFGFLGGVELPAMLMDVCRMQSGSRQHCGLAKESAALATSPLSVSHCSLRGCKMPRPGPAQCKVICHVHAYSWPCIAELKHLIV